MAARHPWLSHIRNAQSSAEQVAALKALKNEVVGNPVLKEAVVTQGVLDPVTRLVFNKAGLTQNGKSHEYTFASRPLNEEETVRLHGIQILASIAHGGPAFLAPLQAAAVLPAILTNLCPSSNPAQLVVAALRALSNLADSAALATTGQTLSTSNIADALFSRQNLKSICRILSQSSPSTAIQTQISITALLISRTCQEERHQQGLANSGVLDALATKLAGFVVARGLVIPGAELTAQRDALEEFLPPAAPPTTNSSVILEAISVIIADSKLRASQLLYSPSILATLPISQLSEAYGSQNTRSAWKAFNSAGLSVRQSQLNAIDFLLPFVPFPQVKTSNNMASAFPPLGYTGSRDNLNPSVRGARGNVAPLPSWGDHLGLEGALNAQDGHPVDTEEPESPLIAYLLLCIRSRYDMERLMAAAVLTVLYRAGLTNKTREITIGLLVIPPLVQMMEELNMPKDKDDLVDDEAEKLEWAMKERISAIIAMLVTDNEYLQKAAVETGILPKLSTLLKVSYDPVAESESPQPWSPHSDEEDEAMDVNSPRLGHCGQSPLLAHKIRVRETTLKAIASVVCLKDEYRKIVVDQGMMPYIVESMSMYPKKPAPKSSERAEKITNGNSNDKSNKGYGINPTSVMIAACGAVRALSRSVSVLRTTLIDNGVAEPVFNLLRHSDIEVQVAATAAVCNLVTDVSPMRELITEAGVVKILCEHAHSMNAKLRLNAVWALKHFVQGVSNDTKRLCLEELGQGWLVQLICDDTEDEALHSSQRKPERGADTPVGDQDQDTEMDQFEEQIDSAFGTNARAAASVPPTTGRSQSVQTAKLRLAALRDAELNPARKARKDDIAVQEQGLDFIRNLIGGAGQGGQETTDMIDFLFSTLGQDRVFEILASKLRPKAINPYNRRHSGSSESRVIPPQAEIICAVGYILVHMAASVPRHRQLVIAQTELLKLLVQQFNHPHTDVRLSLCWLVTNLTWMDDQNDALACVARANELRKMGFYDRLEALEDDPELNVRERAKSAIWQMKQSY